MKNKLKQFIFETVRRIILEDDNYEFQTGYDRTIERFNYMLKSFGPERTVAQAKRTMDNILNDPNDNGYSQMPIAKGTINACKEIIYKLTKH